MPAQNTHVAPPPDAAPDPAMAISAQHLTRVFGSGEARMVAVDDVSLDIPLGQMLYIVGPSGSGKTTLLSMVSGILRPSAGRVLVKGVDIWSMSASDDARFRLHNIGFVFQDFHLFPRLTTAENVAIPLVLRVLPGARRWPARCRRWRWSASTNAPTCNR